MFSYFEPNFIEKFLGASGFQILAKIETTWNKNRLCLFFRHFETVQHFVIFFPELWFLIAYTYMVQISLQNSGGKVVFLRGYCTPGPYFGRLRAFSQKINQLRTKYPMDLVRNVPRNSKTQFYFSRDHCCEVTMKNVWKSIFSMFWAINQ